MGLDNKKLEQQPELTEEEIVNAYLNQLDADTPDLWDRIETGIDAFENSNAESKENIRHTEKIEDIEKKRKKKTSVKWITTAVSLAAVLLAAILVIPYLNGNQRKTSDSAMTTNDVASKGETQTPNYDAAPDVEEYDQSDAIESVQENYVNGAAYEDDDNVDGQPQTETNGNDIFPEEQAGSVGFDHADGEQSITCVVKIMNETDTGYHCEVMAIDENPFDLSIGTEIDAVCLEGNFQFQQDMILQAEILNKAEDGSYIVILR